MSDLITKLNSILSSKIAISGALVAKGIDVNGASFSSYANLISNMSGSSINFYKCASVDTINQEWTGYLASIDSTTGVWSFASTATTGLTYDRITPVVGKVYDEECTFEASRYKTLLPTTGLVFYAPFESAKAVTETGQTLNTGGTPVYTSFNGIPCVHLPNGTWMHSYLDGATVMSAFTITTWRYPVNGTQGGYYHYGVVGDSYNQTMLVENSYVYYDHAKWLTLNSMTDDNAWYFEVTTWDGQYFKFYRNNSLLDEASISSDVLLGNNVIFGAQLTNGAQNSNDIYIAAFRIYNRVLTSEEINALASEFTPTAS